MTAPSPRTCRAILVIAVVVVMGRLLLADFTWWDDQMTIHHNPLMNPVELKTFGIYWSKPVADIYAPLTQTIWALLTFIARVQPDDFGISLNPTFYHGLNLLAHAGGAVAAWAFLRRLVKNDLAALLGALFWAVHPVQVESVGWISGFKDVLSGALVLTTLAIFLQYRQDERRRSLWLMLGVYALAMLAKPSAFTTPLLIIALDRLVIRTPWRKMLRTLVPMLLMTIPIALIARAAQPAPGSKAPAWVRTLLVGDTVTFYTLKIIAPVHLIFDYGRTLPLLRASREFYFAWLLPIGVLAGLPALYLYRRRQGRPLSPLPAVGLLLFVLAPLHVLGVTRFDFQTISTVADHYLYVAVIGPALLLAWAVARWPKLTIVAAVAVSAYGARAAWQTHVWQDSEALFSHTLAINPNSWSSYSNLSLVGTQRRDMELSLHYLEQAERIAPNDASVTLNMLAFYVSQDDQDKTLYYARRLIGFHHDYWLEAGGSPASAHTRIVGLLMASDRRELADEFIKEGLALDPAEPSLLTYAEQLRWKRRAMPASTPATAPTPTPTTWP